MSDQQPVPPAVVQVQAAAPALPPTTAQVVSAAVQNIVAIIALCAGWLAGKVDTIYAIPAILLVVGIDFAGRRKLPGSNVAAIGATGIGHVLGMFPHLAAVLALASVLSGCSSNIMPRAGNALLAIESAFHAVCDDAPAKAYTKCNTARTAINVAVDSYTAANDEVRAAQAASDADAGE